MNKTQLPPLQRQLRRAGRRLFLQRLLDRLTWCLAAALVLAALWFLVEQPYLFVQPPAWQRWAVAGGLLGLGLLVSIGLALFRAPGRLTTALAIDERFLLKERVTTSLLLGPDQLASPAGQALLADTEKHVAGLDVGSRFPLRPKQEAIMVPVALGVLAAIALFYDPPKPPTPDNDDERQALPFNGKEIAEKVTQLRKKDAPQEPVQSEKLKELEDELERIAAKPFDTRDQLKERIKELTDNEDRTKKMQEEMADKDRRLKDQLKALDRLAKKDKKGPADQLRDALSKGDFEKARDEVDRLRKKMKQKEAEGGLDRDDKERLQKQLDELQDQLQRLSRQEDKADELQRLHREGQIDKETLDRELDQLKADAEKMKDLEELARELDECKECMNKGEMEQAEEALERMAEKLEKMDGDSKETKMLLQKLKQVRAAKAASCRGLDQDKKGQESRGSNNPTPASGRRPLAEPGETDAVDKRERAPLDTRGQIIVGGFAPGQNYKKKPAREIEADVKQASQEAPEAIERQNIPRDARDLTRGYFRNLGGQKDANK